VTSYWDDIFQPEAAAEYRSGFRRSAYDVAIVGGGIIGMSTAIELKERDPHLNVVVIERSWPPKGASTRNAGFACFGSLSEIAHDIDLMGADRARDLVRRRLEGLVTLRKRCGDDEIDYEQNGGHEIFLEHHPALDRLDEINALLEPLFQDKVFERRDDLIDWFGFKGVYALVRTPFEGQLHSGKMVKRLWEVAERHGVEVHIDEGIDLWYGPTEGTSGRDLRYGPTVKTVGSEIIAKTIILATNALYPTEGPYREAVPTAEQSLPKVSPAQQSLPKVSPARGQILLTEPIPATPLWGTFHMNEGYVYFRNVGERILLGGGRDQAFDEEQTTEFGITDTIQQYLENLLHTVIAPGKPPAIQRRWSGIMGFREDKQPFVGEVAPGIIQAFGCNGMGVALGSSIGAETAEAVGTVSRDRW